MDGREIVEYGWESKETHKQSWKSLNEREPKIGRVQRVWKEWIRMEEGDGDRRSLLQVGKRVRGTCVGVGDWRRDGARQVKCNTDKT